MADDVPAGGPTLLTARLVLEPLVPAHAEAAFAGFADPALYGYMPGTAPAGVDELRAEFARLARGSGRPDEVWLNWIVRARLGDACVGWSQATVSNGSTASIAYATFLPYAGRGYAREAVAAMLGWLWSDPALVLIVAQTDVRNQASQRVVEALGFVRDPDSVESELRGSTTRDYVFRLRRTEPR